MVANQISSVCSIILDVAIKYLLKKHEARCGVPRGTDGKRTQLVLIGLGKLGGQEMNYSNSQAALIRSVRPGLTGIGSLLLRDEESLYGHRTDASEFYKNKISPYKAELEIWYVKNQSLLLDISIIFLTLFAILFPRLRVEDLFSSIPKPPKDLKN